MTETTPGPSSGDESLIPDIAASTYYGAVGG